MGRYQKSRNHHNPTGIIPWPHAPLDRVVRTLLDLSWYITIFPVCFGLVGCMHWFTHQKSVHQYRYFLSSMCTPILLLTAHASCLEIAIRPACIHGGVCMEVHLNRTTYYAWANNKTIGVHIEKRKYLYWCTPWCVVYTLRCKPVYDEVAPLSIAEDSCPRTGPWSARTGPRTGVLGNGKHTQWG